MTWFIAGECALGLNRNAASKKSIAKRFRIHIKFPFLCLYCDIQDEDKDKEKDDWMEEDVNKDKGGEGVVEGGGGG